MSEVLDSSRKNGLFQDIGTKFFEPLGAAFDLDMNAQTCDDGDGYSEAFDDYIAQCKAADVRVWKVLGAILAAASGMIGVWMLFKIAYLFGQVFSL